MISKLMLKFRTQNKMTQEDLGVLLNVTGNYISKIERETVTPSYKLVSRFFEVVISNDYDVCFADVEKDSMILTLTWLINKLPHQKSMYVAESILSMLKAVNDTTTNQ